MLTSPERARVSRRGAWVAVFLLALALAFLVATRSPVALLVHASAASAPQSVTLQSGQDTYLRAWAPQENHGADQTIKVRQGVHRSLLRFDLSPLPAGSEIISATLQMYAHDMTGKTPLQASVYQVLRPWSALAATWHSADSFSAWEVAGCAGASDRASPPVSSSPISSANRWYSFDVTSVVRAWVTEGVANEGLILDADATSFTTDVFFRSFDSADPVVRPRLVVVYTSDVVPTTTPPESTATPSLTHTPRPTAASSRTPVPDSLYPYPEQRLGVVLFRMLPNGLQDLGAGFAKLEQRGPKSWEASSGADFCTVLLLHQNYNVPDPQTYREKIGELVADNPGHLWFIGNEQENPHRDRTHSSSYAQIYHDLYYLIKGVDPTARVGIGGVVLPSPFRRQWLDRVLSSYQGRYHEPMPVDVWNIHNLLLSECPRVDQAGCASSYACIGAYLPLEFGCQKGLQFSQHDQGDVEAFKRLILEFRQWMKDRGFQDKELIVTEMGVFARNSEVSGASYPHERINRFMTETFDFMMNTTDPDIGCTADGYRLVQRWTWFKLMQRGIDDGQTLEANGWLVNIDGSYTDFGLNYRNYVAQFLPRSPVTIFFQRGWTGHDADCDTTISSTEARPVWNRLSIGASTGEKALVKFDLTRLPADIEVVSATLTLYSSQHVGGSIEIGCYGIRRPWQVFSASWSQAQPDDSWQAPGCTGTEDRTSDPVSTVLVSEDRVSYSWDVTALARQWVAGPETNHGVLLEALAGSGTWKFISSDQAEGLAHVEYRQRPKLELVIRQMVQEDPIPTATATATPTATQTPTTEHDMFRVLLPVIMKGS